MKKQFELYTRIKNIWIHLKDFSFIWIFIGLLLLSVFLVLISDNLWNIAKIIGFCSLLLIMLLLLIKPMNAVYGLIGTSGSIRLFFCNFILITIIFSLIYYFGFLNKAGISYDVNQPHIDYQRFANTSQRESVCVVESRDTLFVEHLVEGMSFPESIIQVSRDTIHYQNINFWSVWRSTILTTLAQEPSDLLACATVHNKAMESSDVGLDEQKSTLFEWILIFHIIISWIFLGVFISLLYSKFRYEA